MLLKLAEDLALNAPIDEVWRLLRDTSRLTGLLPGVENVESLNEAAVEGYAARVSEKIGPFKLDGSESVLRIAGVRELHGFGRRPSRERVHISGIRGARQKSHND